MAILTAIGTCYNMYVGEIGHYYKSAGGFWDSTDTATEVGFRLVRRV